MNLMGYLDINEGVEKGIFLVERLIKNHSDTDKRQQYIETV